VVGILMIPVTFAVVEYLSHRFTTGGKGTTMDSTHPAEEDDHGPTAPPQLEGGKV
jgi:hydrophobic/amphiphilic exporter-1 (mainly G- bacteria), HAE1 family